MGEKYVIRNPDGSTEGRHPDDLDFTKIPHVKGSFAAIRAKCLDCAHNSAEVRKCVLHTCPLWPYRLGRKPESLKSKRGPKKDG